MNRMRTILVSGILIAFAAAATAMEPAASGRFSVADDAHTAADAVAWHGAGDYPLSRIAVSDKHFDSAAMVADGEIDDADLMDHTGASLLITYRREDLEVIGIRLRNRSGSGADFRCEGQGLLSLSRDDGQVVAGSFDCEEHQVSFTAPVLSTPGG